MKMPLKILILSVLMFFLLTGSALATSLSGNLFQNYFNTTSLELKSVNDHIMPLYYSLVGKELAADHDFNITPEDKVIDASDNNNIVSHTKITENADGCMFVENIVELSIVSPAINSIAYVPEPATIMLIGFGLLGLGGWARRLQKIREI
jgi:hypothetical protein